ncbi:MAG: hypothetical protein COA97_01475 [Flavobacteriales bacterium]|nr:MAG: hypothetical protein COA97_01475 [Flavobacteriales bacterium]
MINLNRKIGVLTLRLLLGFIILMQGFGKVFTWGVENLYNMPFFRETYKDYLPDIIIHATAYYTSYVELIAGLFIIIGFKRDYALYAMASVLVIVTFGHGLTDPIWDLSHVMYRAILLITLLLLPKNWDQFSLDYFIKKK